MTTHRNRLGRRLLALAASGALAAGLVAVTAPAATAAPATTSSDTARVTGATLSWGLSNEQGGGAFFGGCNFLSAGTAGDTGSSRLWTEADGFYKTTDGNVTVTKPNASGVQTAPTWSTKCETPQGTAVSASSTTSLSLNQVNLAGGVGTASSTGAGTVQWTGSFTSVFYGGLTYWTATNPKLVVDAAGNGTLTATASGYAASMEDSSKWEAIPPRTITLAKLTNAALDADGFTSTPAYLGVEVTTQGTAQTRTGPSWGSFPQDFVDFQYLTGQSSYWYSSGGSRDAAKPASPLTVGGYATATPTVTVSETVVEPGTVPTVTVTGTNFDKSLSTGTRQPFLNRPGGSYVAFAKVADSWRPSTGAASSTRGQLAQNVELTKWALPADQMATAGPAAVELEEDGSFSASIKLDKATLDAAVGSNAALTKYGIITYGGSGGNAAAYETFTPILFKAVPEISLTGPETVVAGQEATYTVDLGSEVTGPVTFSGIGDDEVVDLEDGLATFTLPADQAAGEYTLEAAFAGDDTFEAVSDTLDVVVAKTESTPTISAPTSSPFGTAHTVTVTVPTENGLVPTGQVTLTGAGTQATSLVDGKATFTLSRTLSVGAKTLSVSYAGDARYVDLSATKSFTVAKAPVVTSSRTTLKPTSTKTGKAVISVKSKIAGAPTPSGTIRVFYSRSGYTTRNVAKALSGGSATVTVPKLPKGTWKVSVRYSGSPGSLNTPIEYKGSWTVTR